MNRQTDEQENKFKRIAQNKNPQTHKKGEMGVKCYR